MKTDSKTNRPASRNRTVTLTFSREADSQYNIEVRGVTGDARSLRKQACTWMAGVLAGLAVALSGNVANAQVAGKSVDLAVLVVAAQTNDYTLAPIQEALDFLGTAYRVHFAADAPNTLTAAALSDGTRGYYSGVILTTASLSYSPDGGSTWQSALSPDEWNALNQYEAAYGVRRVNWYAYPTPEFGFNWPHSAVDTFDTPVSATWTAAGAQGFVYLNTTNSYSISNVWAFLATPFDANTTVWLQDGEGNALMASKVYPDGREVLTMTFDSATWSIPSTVLYHGLVNWVNRGVFLGERHTYLSAQIDDVFLADDIYTGGEYRQTAADWKATLVWQKNFRNRVSGKNFRYDMAFNGFGTSGLYAPDDLTPYARKTQSAFKWISHTYSHPYLDQFTYDQSLPEIVKNNQSAAELKLKRFKTLNMVTPNITGLENPQFMNAAYDAGIRYLVTDMSIPHHRPTSPNVGIPNWHVPGVLMIPRHANNLFYNVSTPAQWEAEYNALYSNYWGRNLTYSEILDDQSDLLLRALLKGDVSPQMFHQPNLRDYNGRGNTLLGDLLDKVADKYEAFYNFPFLSPEMDKLGEGLKRRMAYNESGVRATRNADGSITVTADQAAVVPMTGVQGRKAEFYAGQYITYVRLAAGGSVTIPANSAVTTTTDTTTVTVTTTESDADAADGSEVPTI